MQFCASMSIAHKSVVSIAEGYLVFVKLKVCKCKSTSLCFLFFISLCFYNMKYHAKYAENPRYFAAVGSLRILACVKNINNIMFVEKCKR